MPATFIKAAEEEGEFSSATEDSNPAPGPLFSFLGQLLAEQQMLQTPVARFSEARDRNGAPPASAPFHRDWIPLTRPGPGEQYAFEVELDSCTGCKACVSACHSLNGLDDGETWRDTGLLVSPEPRHPFTQTITTACHHCADPGCLNGCPVLAYEKDSVTGIVRHLDDQCIGCSYCVMKCPYDVPKYNPARGIVRKCDLCQGRLAHGEAPACVQACPTRAIRVVTVKLRWDGKPCADTSAFLAAAPDPGYTQPTTRYVSRREMPGNLVAADAAAVQPQPPHWPLVVMLTLMGLAVGCGAAAAVMPASPAGLVILGWVAGTAGLVASVLHLGQPRRAWRIFLGLRRSWLSREALAFGVWWAAAGACAVEAGKGAFVPGLIALTAALGLAGLLCSVMVYVDTRRVFWRFAQTAPRFFGSALVLGLGAAFAASRGSTAPGLALAGAMAAKLGFETLEWHAPDDEKAALAAGQTARLLAGPLRRAGRLRRWLGFAGGVLVPLLAASGAIPADATWTALALVFFGEMAERYLFFRAVIAMKMPGVGHA